MLNRQSAIGNRQSERGFAILMVVLVLVGLLIIGAPFAISMRQQEHASINFAAQIRAKLGAQGALNWAMAQLERTHEFIEQTETEDSRGADYAIFNSPQVDANGEFRVNLDHLDLSAIQTADPTGAMWGVAVADNQGKINLKTATRRLLRNLLEQFFGEARGQAVADAIIAYRDTSRRQFTTLTQLREIGANVTPAEFDQMAPFLTVHSASLVGEVSSASRTLHPVNPNTCREETLRALLRGLTLKKQDTGDPDPDPDPDPGPAAVTDAEVDALIARLRVVSKLASGMAAGDGTVPVDDASGFPEQGWVSIEGDAVKYASKSGNSLVVSTEDDDPACRGVDEAHPHRPNIPVSEVEVRLLITDVDHDLKGILDTMVDASELTADARSAILANAIDPLNGEALDLTTTTAPLCFRSFNIYTIEATGVVNAPDGRELARHTIVQVAQVAPVGSLEIRIETQADFEASVQAGLSYHVATWPNFTPAADNPPANVEAPPTLLFDRGRLGMGFGDSTPTAGTSFNLLFNGPLTTNTLDGDEGTRTPEPDELTTVKCADHFQRGGPRVGENDDETEKTVLVYSARDDDDPGLSNIPHGDDYVHPFILEMWVKFDPKDKFGYDRDHFLFDLAEDTFTNRVALYYDSTSADGGDLVLHVCDATLQKLPAQIRYPITADTFQPERWYHLAAVIKGLGYNQMALLVNGRSVGHYEPSAMLTADLEVAATTATCDNLAEYQGGNIFAPYTWPDDDCVVINGELMEFLTADPNTLNGLVRGARGSWARRHFAGTRVELYGYDDYLRPGSYSWQNTEYPGPEPRQLLKIGEAPSLVANLPAIMQIATIDDGDDQTLEPPLTNAPDTTAKKTTQFWNPAAEKYQAADLEGNTIPASDWLPVSYCEMWIVEAGQEPADDETKFKQTAGQEIGGKPEDNVLAGFLIYNAPGNDLSTTQRSVEDATNGLGFIRVLENKGEDDENKAGEIIKFSKAGVVLVWRWHPDDTDDPETEQDERRKIAWYIGYIGGLGAAAAEPPEPPAPPPAAVTYARRACFGTEMSDIVEGARIRFDCMKFNRTDTLALGHREEIISTIEQPGGDVVVKIGKLNGVGIFQLYRGADYYEWVEFAFPQFKAEEDETALLTNQWLVQIYRSRSGTVPGGSDHTGRAFQAGIDKVMPVFFSWGRVGIMDNWMPVVKGSGDKVSLIDRTGQREAHVINHGSGHYFAFREDVGGTYFYGDEPRILKFPSGNLPSRPDDLMFIGSDSDFDDHYTGETGLSPVGDPVEPERPANATFSGVKVYPAGSYPACMIYDWQASAEPPETKNTRWVAFAPDSDAPPIPQDLAPPFYIRVGHLERLSRKPPDPAPGDPPLPFQQPFRFIANGHTSLPHEGYLKIDDEVMFYRTFYRNRLGHHSASIVLPRHPAYDENGLAIALDENGSYIYVDENGADFPEEGYITISNSYPHPDYWLRIGALATQTGLKPAQIAAWLGETGNPLLSEGGGRLISSGGYSSQERLFYDSKDKITIDGKEVWKLNIKHRAILNSTAKVVKFVDPDNKPSWFVEEYTSPGGGNVHVVSVELCILRRGCLGTERTRHAVGTICLPLEHIPTSLTPRSLVKLKRNEDGTLQRDPDDTNLILALEDDDADFDIAKDNYEYGIVLEDRDYFPTEGYVQLGDEIIGYTQDGSGSSGVWNASVPMWDEAQHKWVRKTMPCLTGLKHFRQRYGTARAKFMDYKPGEANALKYLDPGVPDPEKDPGHPHHAIQPYSPYWVDHEKHVVHAIPFRFHDRFPQREPRTPDEADASYVGKYAPHRDNTKLGHYEFAVTLPGARWTRVQWTELLYRKSGDDWTLSNDPLADTDPFDVKVLVQIDGTPGWNDMTQDPVAGANTLVSTPVLWSDFTKANRPDAYDLDPNAYRPRKPVVFMFDQAYDPDDAPTSRPKNYINPYNGGPRGQAGDRIRFRVLFQYRNKAHAAPTYDIPWRTPWVDTIRLHYRAPTYIMEHREMPY